MIKKMLSYFSVFTLTTLTIPTSACFFNFHNTGPQVASNFNLETYTAWNNFVTNNKITVINTYADQGANNGENAIIVFTKTHGVYFVTDSSYKQIMLTNNTVSTISQVVPFSLNGQQDFYIGGQDKNKKLAVERAVFNDSSLTAIPVKNLPQNQTLKYLAVRNATEHGDNFQIYCIITTSATQMLFYSGTVSDSSQTPIDLVIPIANTIRGINPELLHKGTIPTIQAITVKNNLIYIYTKKHGAYYYEIGSNDEGFIDDKNLAKDAAINDVKVSNDGSLILASTTNGLYYAKNIVTGTEAAPPYTWNPLSDNKYWNINEVADAIMTNNGGSKTPTIINQFYVSNGVNSYALAINTKAKGGTTTTFSPFKPFVPIPNLTSYFQNKTGLSAQYQFFSGGDKPKATNYLYYEQGTTFAPAIRFNPNSQIAHLYAPAPGAANETTNSLVGIQLKSGIEYFLTT